MANNNESLIENNSSIYRSVADCNYDKILNHFVIAARKSIVSSSRTNVSSNPMKSIFNGKTRKFQYFVNKYETKLSSFMFCSFVHLFICFLR